MKKILYKILFVNLLLLSRSVSFAQAHRIDSVKIEFEGFYTETFFAVTCDAFDNMFLKTKKVITLHKGQSLSNMASLQKDFKLTKQRSLDVRGKITYHYGNRVVKYCFDEFAYFYKDGKFYFNKKLLIAISNCLYSDHPQYLDTLRYHE